ncbi:hypothetical protein MTX20_16720 [Bradyrhizobium sp. ISRA435]|nr:hypothetical protein MTX20_16720 [Bradyrhizobium sp. ISRA435]
MAGAVFIGRGLQRAEQEIQSASAVGRNLRQLARGFGQFLLGPGRRNDPGIALCGRRDRHSQKSCDQYRQPAMIGPKES